MDSPTVVADESSLYHQRLWAPWRMQYVGNSGVSHDCIFCARLAADDDISNLILWRGEHSFVIMNLYPYNTGHVMVVPNDHVPVLDELGASTLSEIGVSLRGITRALQRALSCHGFNIGLNIGGIAGAGIAEHLHQHVVPRWHGDVNFMPVVGQTTVLPELIPITYAKLRAELAREHAGDHFVLPIVLYSPSRSEVELQLGTRGWRLPTVGAQHDEPVWRTAINALGNDRGGIELIGTASAEHHVSEHPPALVFQQSAATDAVLGTRTPLDEALALLPDSDRAYVTSSSRQV